MERGELQRALGAARQALDVEVVRDGRVRQRALPVLAHHARPRAGQARTCGPTGTGVLGHHPVRHGLC